MLYEINKTTEIVADTTTGNTESVQITEVVKSGSIFGPTMWQASTKKDKCQSKWCRRKNES